jgi:outer membrane lipoprotein-sorting protein
VRHRASFGPSSKSRSHPTTPERGLFARSDRLALLALAALVPLLLAAVGCATWNPPPPQAAEKAAVAGVYSGSLRVSVKGENVRGRSPVLIAFQRPAGLRLEIPGSAGARLVAVVRGEGLVAVLPAHRAVYQGTATAADFDALLGIALAPDELMDVLVGVAPPRLRSYRAGWGEQLPERIEAVLPDGTRLKATVDDAEIGLVLPAAAFEFPPHPGYRPVDAAEARSLLGGR